jgi:hypothetical protein
VEHLWELECDGLILDVITDTCCCYANNSRRNAYVPKDWNGLVR